MTNSLKNKRPKDQYPEKWTALNCVSYKSLVLDPTTTNNLLCCHGSIFKEDTAIKPVVESFFSWKYVQLKSSSVSFFF